MHIAGNGEPSTNQDLESKLKVRDEGCDFVSDCTLVIHAVFPPPVTGMTLCTERVAAAASQRVPVIRYNWSMGAPRISPWFRFVKLVRAVLSPVRLLLGKRPNHGVFYMPCNAGLATVYNFIAIAAARARGYRCVLHHHYFRYVDRHELRIKMLTKVLGPNDLQIVLCPAMERGLRAHYGRHLPLAVMPSTIQLLTSSLSAPVCPDPPLMKNCFVIGHLSNLQIAKGLDLVIDVFRALRGRGRDVRLILAGPIDTNVERQMIADAQAEFGDLVDYRGPVYGADKEAFFRDIHAIVYPTRNDAQPLVIMEAFSHGRPVISYGRGCIPDMLPIAAWLVPPDADFVMPAADQLERWINSSSEYVADGQRARKAFDAAIKDARIALDSFVHWVCLEPDHGFVRRGVDRPTLVTLEV